MTQPLRCPHCKSDHSSVYTHEGLAKCFECSTEFTLDEEDRGTFLQTWDDAVADAKALNALNHTARYQKRLWNWRSWASSSSTASMDDDIVVAIREVSKSFSLDPLLVRALVETESAGHPYAWNPEPHYRYFWDVKQRKPFRQLTPAELRSKTPPPDFGCLAGDPDQEWWGQQVSWGLMQVMGAVARERGFRGPYLAQLTSVPSNLTYGCGHLAALLAWAREDAEQALAGYNGGRAANVTRPFRNASYAAKVLAARASLANLNLKGRP